MPISPHTAMGFSLPARHRSGLLERLWNDACDIV